MGGGGLNGYGEYEFDWCICDKVMACTIVGVRRWRRRGRQWRNQKHPYLLFLRIMNLASCFLK